LTFELNDVKELLLKLKKENKYIMEMRQVFSNCLAELMEKDENIVIIDADLGKANGTMPLRKRFPERAFDVGIAEQNMACVAAGLASYGFKPFISSFTPFATRRIADQISVSICYAGMPVKIIGTDPGITATINGGTHMSVEDLGILRSIPNIIIYEPIDEVQLAKSMPIVAECDKPMYIRLHRKDRPVIFDEKSYEFSLGKADVLREGKDVTIVAMGIMVEEALKTDLDADIIAVHTLKPIDRDTILNSVKKTGRIVTMENHNVIGGLYSAVSEIVAEVKPIGIQDRFGQVGSLDDLKKEYGMLFSEI
jgi:transketolase